MNTESVDTTDRSSNRIEIIPNVMHNNNRASDSEDQHPLY